MGLEQSSLRKDAQDSSDSPIHPEKSPRFYVPDNIKPQITFFMCTLTEKAHFQGQINLMTTQSPASRIKQAQCIIPKMLLLPSFTLCTRPPIRSVASRIVTSVKPLSKSAFAADRPASPAPITTIRGCRFLRRPLLRGSSVLSADISQLCMPSKLSF